MADSSGRLIAIGDVHGCAHALDTLLDMIGPQAPDTFVFLGDLVDQGHNSREVIDRILELRRTCNVVVIRGNHEEMMLAARDNEAALRYWEMCGGVMTLNSYRYGAGLNQIPPEHWALLEESRDYFETEHCIFTHANYLPEVPMNAQPTHQLRWALFDPAEARPHVSGKPVIVGHTEQSNSEVLDLGFAVCIDTACWRHGWLTAWEPATGQVWQTSRWGIARDPGEMPHRGRVPVLARKVPA